MYTRVNLDDLSRMEVDRTDPDVKPVGYELRPSAMRPNYWVYEAGESNNRHKQREQEELYYVVSGEGTMEIDGEVIDLTPGDVVVVKPDAWRQVTAESRLELFVIGAPNVKDDGILEDEA